MMGVYNWNNRWDVLDTWEVQAYVDNFEYSEFKDSWDDYFVLKRINNPEGYVSSLEAPMCHYYRRDHLGNVREVMRKNAQSDDVTVQRTQYYPSGLPWAYNSGDNPELQSYKYNEKEFVEMHGYDSYDYGARGMYPAIGRFTSVDPLAEDYYDVSPYAYVLNNPLNYTDPTEMSAKKENEDEPKDGGELTEIVVIAPKPEPKPSNFEIKTNVIVIPVPLAVSASLANITRYVLPVFFLFNTIGSDTNRYYASNKNSPHANQKAKEAAKKEYEKTKEEYDKLYKKPNKTPNDKNNIEKLKRVLKHLKEKMDFKGETHSRNAKGN